eukprot:4166765-Pleurochrysis_carterae.AAC.2
MARKLAERKGSGARSRGRRRRRTQKSASSIQRRLARKLLEIWQPDLNSSSNEQERWRTT